MVTDLDPLRGTGSFRPPAWLSNRHLQSIVPSLPLRRPAV
jgi:hypothetical protein